MKFLKSHIVKTKGLFLLGIIAPFNCLFSAEYDKLLKLFSEKFTTIDFIINQKYFFPEPSSYKNEMGGILTTQIVVFSQLREFHEIILLKKLSENIEEIFSYNEKRRFNINPGIISKDGLFLASHKPSRIRSYIGDNTWIEQQYASMNNYYIIKSSTFPEYREPECFHKLNQMKKSNKTLHGE